MNCVILENQNCSLFKSLWIFPVHWSLFCESYTELLVRRQKDGSMELLLIFFFGDFVFILLNVVNSSLHVLNTVISSVCGLQSLWYMRSYIHWINCACTFIDAFFIVIHKWKQPKFPSRDDWINKPMYPFTGILLSN